MMKGCQQLVAMVAVVACLVSSVGYAGGVRPQQGGEPSVKIGDRLPDALLNATNGAPVRLTDSEGRVKLISIGPQLNTPVCDEQTHHMSEQNQGLDRQIDIITLSTNTTSDQARFAKKANISNIRFLSDAPAHEFGTRTGLLLPLYGVLHRAVMVADGNNVIRYFELVPMGQLPNFEAAFDVARKLTAGQ